MLVIVIYRLARTTKLTLSGLSHCSYVIDAQMIQ